MTPEIALEHVSRGWSHEQIAEKFGVPPTAVGLSVAGALSAIRSSSRIHPLIVEKLPNPLEARETEVARLLAQGKGNREIASELCMAYKTAKNHVWRIFRRLGVETRHAAAMKLQFIDLGDE